MRELRDLLVVVNDLSPYGAQRVAVALVDEWVARGVDVTVVTVEDPAEGDLTLPEGVRRVQLRRRGGRARALVELVRAGPPHLGPAGGPAHRRVGPAWAAAWGRRASGAPAADGRANLTNRTNRWREQA